VIYIGGGGAYSCPTRGVTNYPRRVNQQRKGIDVMGDKSPKSVHKQVSQKELKKSTDKEKKKQAEFAKRKQQ
jgi:hypothetical protein